MSELQKSIDAMINAESKVIGEFDKIHDISDCVDEVGELLEEHECKCDGDSVRILDAIHLHDEAIIERCKKCGKVKKIEWLEGAWG